MSASKKGLGRGFESLIPVDLLDESFDPTANQDKKVSELRQIKISEIIPDPDQPRKIFNEEELEELATSLKEHGILQPIIVTPHKGIYKIVAGERRFRAAKKAELDKVPALVRTLSNQHMLEISLIENVQRQDLNVMETATAYVKLRDQFNLSIEEIGKRVGIGNGSVSSISNKIRLLKLPDFARKALADKEITEGQARPLIGLEDDLVKRLLQKIIKEGWSARKVEQFVVNYKKASKNKTNDRKKKVTAVPYKKQLDHLKARLETEVKIQTNARGAGKITIAFKDEDDFKRLQKIIG